MLWVVAAGVAVSLGMVSPVAAQHPQVLSALSEMNRRAPPPEDSELVQGALGATVSAAERFGGCKPTSVSISGLRPTTGDRQVMAGVLAQQLRNGWRFEGQLEGCGAAETADFLAIQPASGPLQVILLNFGTSLTSYSVARDAMPQAIMLAGIMLKKAGTECSATDLERIMRSRVAERSKNLGPEMFGVRYTGDWTEVWTLQLCGRTVEVGLMFTPDGDGGARFQVSERASKVLPASTAGASLGQARAVDCSHVQRVLGVRLWPAEETIVDTANSLLETGIVKA
jgi:hypothetical protein